MKFLKKLFNKKSGYDAEIDKYINTSLKIKNDLLSIFDQNEEIVIFDIGACEGADSIRYKKLFPNAKVFAFEPLSQNIKKIKHNLKRYQLINEIQVINKALGEEVGEMKFFISSGRPDKAKKSKDWDYGNKSSSLFPPKDISKTHGWHKFQKEVKVKVDTIKDFCQKNYVDHIDFIHLDVQGAEIQVLKGAGDLINNIKAIWLEVANREMYEGQPLKNDIEKFMRENKFKKVFEDLDDYAGDQLYIKDLDKKKEVIEIEVDENKILIPVNRKWCFKNGHYYERNVEYWIQKILKESDNPMLYDIGANIGIYSIKFANLCRGIYSFEPVDEIFSILTKNIKNNKKDNVTAFKIALSNTEGTSQINLYSSSGCNSLIKRNIPEDNPVKFLKEEKVKLSKLDTFIVKKDLKSPSIVKIDVEGAEKFILEGSSETINNCRPIVVCEYSEDTCNDAGYNKEEIINQLPKDYIICGLSEEFDDYELKENYNDKKVANIIALPKENTINNKL